MLTAFIDRLTGLLEAMGIRHALAVQWLPQLS